jgi:hypothetical protein
MTSNEDREDGDPPIDMEAAARFRQILQDKAQATFDPMHQSLMELMHMGQEYGIQTIVDYDEDFSDISDDW